MSLVSTLLDFATAQEGKPYVWGAEGPSSFDCSGLVQYSYHHVGIDLPRTSEQQAKVGTAVDKGAISAGDLVFSDWGNGPNSHVGIALGGGKIVVAPHTGDVVKSETLSSGYMSHVTAVRRIPQLGTGDPSATMSLGNPVTDAASSIVAPLVQPLKDMADGVKAISGVADLVTKAFLPSNFVRIVCGLVGGMLVLLGMRLLSKEVRP
jgi:hypothetical protein